MSVGLVALALGACGTKGPPAPVFEGRALEAVGDGAFVDPVVTPEQEEALRAALAAARGGVQRFYRTPLVARPRVILCATQRCRSHFTGPGHRSMYIPEGHWAADGTAAAHEWPTVVLTVGGADVEKVAAHELAHAELAAREAPNVAPAWFDEGLATLVAEDVDCWGRPVDAAISLEGLADNRDWTRETSQPDVSKRTYCAARAEVAEWMRARGRDGLLALIAGVRSGEPFEGLYGAAPGGRLWREQVVATTHSRIGGVLHCADQRLARGGRGNQRVVFGWTIRTDGHVEDPRVKEIIVADDALVACLSAEISTWVFPAAHAPTFVGRFPFTFRDAPPASSAAH